MFIRLSLLPRVRSMRLAATYPPIPSRCVNDFSCSGRSGALLGRPVRRGRPSGSAPFLLHFSTSLLILAAVFGVFAYVFLAIGWQLFHPPARRRGFIEETEDEERWASVSARADEQVVGVTFTATPSALEKGRRSPMAAHVASCRRSVETVDASKDVVEEPLSGSAGVLAADSEPIVDTPSSTFSGFAPVPRGGEPRMGEAEEPGSEHDDHGRQRTFLRARSVQETGAAGAGAL